MRFTRLIILIIFFSAPILAKTDTKLVYKLSGINGDALQNVKLRLSIAEKSYGEDKEGFYQNAPQQIKKALEPYGYFKSVVNVNRQGKTILFVIHQGPPLRIKAVDLQINGIGKDDSVIQKSLSSFPLKKGQVLRIDYYEKAKNTLFDTMIKQGYLKAVLEKKAIQIDLQHYTATIVLHLNTGERYYFGSISFNHSPFAPSFMQRFMTFKEGEPFSSEKLLELQHNLSNSHYFKTINVNPEFSQTTNNSVPTTVDTTVPKSQQYSIGMGYGTFTGPRLTLGMNLRRIADKGQHFSADLKLSSVLSGLTTKYYIPGDNPLTDQYTIGLNVQRFVPKNGSSLSETLSAGYSKSLKKWRHYFSLNFLNDRYRENESSLKTSHLLYPSYTLSRISTDDVLNPTLGNSFSLTFQGANAGLASTTSFFQSELKNKLLFSPTTNSKIILASHFGYTVVNNLHDLPLTMNFFAGGLNSVRGYEYDSLGPGKYLKTGSIEFQHKITGNWSGAVFYDLGNASNHFDDPLKIGDGIGIIYSSLIGPLKLYVARAESKDGKPLSFEFSIGPDF